jgi:hypothetical protein
VKPLTPTNVCTSGPSALPPLELAEPLLVPADPLLPVELLPVVTPPLEVVPVEVPRLVELWPPELVAPPVEA